MKVALVYRDALQGGGYPRDVRWLVGSLAAVGASVTLVAKPGDETDGLTDGVRWVEFGAAARPGQWDVVHHLFGIFIPGQIEVARGLPGRVHVVSPGAHLMRAHLSRRWWKKIPYLLWWRARLAGKPVAIHVFSEAELPVVRWILRRAPVFQAPLGVFPTPEGRTPPVPATGAIDRGLAEDYVLFLGRNDIFQKGIDLLLRGFASAVVRGFRRPLVIAGRPWGDSCTQIHRLCVQLGIKDRVSVLGEVGEGTKWELLRRARCLAFLSRWDGPPRPIRESLAAGTPVIVSHGTNMADLVVEEGAGAAVPGEPDVIAEALLASEDPAGLAAWRQGARRLAERLAWPRVAACYLRGYESVLLGREPGSGAGDG
jgi:glycosyltransferase involved in cell wall biosynthesis